MHNPVLGLVMMVDNMMAGNMQMLDTMEGIIAINHARRRIEQLVIAIAYIAIISLVITTSGTVTTNQNTHIKNAAVTFHNTIKNNVADMCHSTIANNVAVKFHNITILANASIAQSILVRNVANTFHNIITSIHNVSQSANQALHNAHHNAHHNVVMVVTEAKKFFSRVSYFQTDRSFLSV